MIKILQFDSKKWNGIAQKKSMSISTNQTSVILNNEYLYEEHLMSDIR